MRYCAVRGTSRHLGACLALIFAAGAPLAAHAYSGTPYTGSPIALPGSFNADNFDKGGQGVAYNDLSAGNLGGQYRNSEDVDIYVSSDAAGGAYQVANFQTGEWMAYTVNVATAGKYDLSIHASNNYGASDAFHIEIDGVNVTGSVPVPVTGSWSTYQWVAKQGIALTAGQHVLKLVADTQWFNVNAISVVASATSGSTGSTGTTGSTSISTTGTTSTTSTTGYKGTPYSGSPIALPVMFYAANFDKGGQGIAYNDLSVGNLGGQYRTSEDVDIYTSTDTSGGPYQVANFQTAEWMNYTVSVPSSGTYNFSIHAANNYATGAYHIEVDGVNATGSVPVPVTGSWSTYQWVSAPGISLSSGQHVLKLVADQQWFNVSAINATASSYAGTPYAGTPIALPAMFYTDNFDNGGQGVAYNDLSVGNLGGQYRTSEDVDIYPSTDTTGGPYQVANFQSGEWMNYTVSVPSSGNYDFSIYAANNYSSGTPAFHIAVDGTSVTGSIPVPLTGSWSTYQWVGAQGIALTAGQHVLRLVADQQWFNVSAISVLASGTTASSGTTSTSTASPSTTTTTSTGTSSTSGSTTTSTTTATSSSTTSTSGSTSTSASTATPSSLLFWTGYEGTTALAGPSSCYSNGCWQYVTGTDPTTGFTWPPVVGGGTAEFQQLVNSPSGSTTSDVGNYMYSQVQSVTGHAGSTTNAMYSQISQSGCCGTGSQDAQSGSTQQPYMLLPASDVPELYISEWVKLQPDLATVMGSGTWRDLFEWKSTDMDYRIQLSIVNYGGGTPHWQMSGDAYVPSYQEFWRIDNASIPVPMGQWFKLEIYWKRSSGSDGRVWMAVNGQVIGDQYAPNIGVNGSPIDRIMSNQLYSGSVYPIYQWIDDLQIWSTFPTAVQGNPWYNTPYASH